MRHGETDWTNGKAGTSPSELPINADGIRQSENMVQIIKDLQFDVVFCSSLLRARQTAEIAVPDREIIFDDRIVEINFGDVGEVALEKRSEVFTAFYDGKFKPKGAETFKEIEYRVVSFLDAVQKGCGSKKVLVITHAGISRVIRRYFWGFPKEKHYSVFPSPKPCEIIKVQ